jgi:hypothetical protein
MKLSGCRVLVYPSGLAPNTIGLRSYSSSSRPECWQFHGLILKRLRQRAIDNSIPMSRWCLTPAGFLRVVLAFPCCPPRTKEIKRSILDVMNPSDRIWGVVDVSAGHHDHILLEKRLTSLASPPNRPLANRGIWSSAAQQGIGSDG